MPRGVSLTPQARSNVKEELSQEMKLSLFEYPMEIREAVARGWDASSPLGGASDGHGTHGHGGSSATGIFPGFGRKAKKSGVAAAPSVQVRIFDHDGNLTSRQTGVHIFHLKRETFFFVLRSLSWKSLLSFSVTVYLLILLMISTAYYFWGWACGAHETTSLVNSFYFTVVSLAANGGYMGEDVDTMGDPNHKCYRGRTLIVMFCSYANIIFVGLVAALVVGKAEYTGALANRIEFSDFCTLVRVPGRIDSWRLAFRMANLENKKPLAHGQLRLFVVSAEPLKEYKMAKRERLQLKRKLEAMEWETREYLQGKAAAAGVSLPVAAPLTAETLERKKEGGLSNTSFSAGALATVNDPNIRAIQNYKRRLAREKAREKAERKEAKRREKETRRRERAKRRGTRRTASRQPSEHASDGDADGGRVEKKRKEGGGHRSRDTVPEEEETAVYVAEVPSRTRGRRDGRGHRRDSKTSGAAGHGSQGTRSGTHSHTPAGEERGHSSSVPSRSRSDVRRTPQRSVSSRSSTASRRSSSRDSLASTTSTTTTNSSSSSTTSSDNLSAKTNSSVGGSMVQSPLYPPGGGAAGGAFSSLPSRTSVTNLAGASVYGTHGSYGDVAGFGSPVRKADGALGRPTSSTFSRANERTRLLSEGDGTNTTDPRGGEEEGSKRTKRHRPRNNNSNSNSKDSRRQPHHHDNSDDDTEDLDPSAYLERVHINVSELSWVAPGERYRNKKDDQLSLWYPATITHTIDERSPLYRFMDIPRVGAALSTHGAVLDGASAGHRRTTPSSSAGLSSRKFQIVAVFDATEMETGATIMAKHTYTTTDIVTHYKFSNKLIHMNPESGEILLDYHYFNEVLPITAIESSTTDSEV